MKNRPIEHDQSEMNVVFIHSMVDDAGLTAAEFRVYCHLSRRASGGEAFPSVPSIQNHCGMSHRTVRAALRVLLGRGMIRRRDRMGTSCIFTITKPSNWIKGGGAKMHRVGGCQSAPGGGANQHPGGVPDSTPKYIQLRISTEGKTPIPPPEDLELTLENTKGLNEPKPEDRIYDSYPRRIGKPAALKAIRLALKTTPFETLADAVGRYALLTARWPAPDRQFIPHPATWFNQRRWEDPETFAPRQSKPGTPTFVSTDGYNGSTTNPATNPNEF